MALLMAISFPVFAWILIKSKFGKKQKLSTEGDPPILQDQGEIASIPKLKIGDWKNQGEFFLPLKLALTGIVMLILAYPLTFTVRAYAISGRDTRVHFGAVIGAALLWASIWYAALLLAQQYKWKKAIAFTLAGVYALLLGFGLVVQWDYQRAWTLQQDLWSDIVKFVPDLNDGTVILVDPEGLVDTKHIDANTWSMPLVMQYIYEFPSSWQNDPRVHRLLPDWEERVLHNSLEIKAVDYKWEYVVVPWNDTVILETSEGRVVNRLEEFQIDGDIYKLKEIETDPRVRYPEGILYKYLISSNQ
jgi:vacuolar-type H+-ATPase subunit I/STV1